VTDAEGTMHRALALLEDADETIDVLARALAGVVRMAPSTRKYRRVRDAIARLAERGVDLNDLMPKAGEEL
jgi:hypothetical protein